MRVAPVHRCRYQDLIPSVLSSAIDQVDHVHLWNAWVADLVHAKVKDLRGEW